MRLCTYIVKSDKGLAPNPFWDYCTLALCTPNHMNVHIYPDDWIAGFTDRKSGNELVYCMKVDEVLNLDEYYCDNRFQCKKPVRNGTAKQQVGDNIYYRDEQGDWRRDSQTRFHRDQAHFAKDTRYAVVYISSNFYYLGRDSTTVPSEFLELLPASGRGVKLDHSPDIVGTFLEWVRTKFTPGLRALPTLFEDCCDCSTSSKSPHQ